MIILYRKNSYIYLYLNSTYKITFLLIYEFKRECLMRINIKRINKSLIKEIKKLHNIFF